MQTAQRDAAELDTPLRRLDRPWRLLAATLAVAWGLFQLATLSVYPIDPWLLRAVHFAFASVLALMLVPAAKRSPRTHPSAIDLLLALAAVAILGYIAVNLLDLVYRVGVRPTMGDIVVGMALIVLTLELARRLTGLGLPIVALLAIAYAVVGADLPGVLGHGGYELDRVSTFLLGTDGIYGEPLGASATFVSLFILFGAFLAASGGSGLFSELATAIAGGLRGGPAKVSVIASSLFGTISGSAVANVVVDGWLTIPTMVRTGFRPAVAAAVEAVASCGGQIMPPIMSAAAFVMAQITGISYAAIVVAAIVPALLYYIGLYWMIDFYAAVKGLKGLPRSELPRIRPLLLDRGHLLLTVVAVFAALVVLETTPIRAALIGLLVLMVVANVKAVSRFTGARIVDAFYQGATGMTTVAATCAAAGIVAGILALTGLGQKFVGILVAASGGSLPVAMVLTALTTIVLGMGVPTVGAYIIAATTAAPALVVLGVPEIAAHLFVLYFAAISTITPPVAIAVFAAAGIARASMWGTGWEAVRLAFAGYLVPFLFVFRPGILLRGDALEIAEDVAIGIVGVTMLAAGFQGWLVERLSWPERWALVGGAVLLLDPGLVTTALGLVLLVGVGSRNLAGWLRMRRRPAPPVS